MRGLQFPKSRCPTLSYQYVAVVLFLVSPFDEARIHARAGACAPAHPGGMMPRVLVHARNCPGSSASSSEASASGSLEKRLNSTNCRTHAAGADSPLRLHVHIKPLASRFPRLFKVYSSTQAEWRCCGKELPWMHADGCVMSCWKSRPVTPVQLFHAMHEDM